MYAYDKDTGEIFGRTPSSWGKCSLFFPKNDDFYIFLIPKIRCIVCVLLDRTVLLFRYAHVKCLVHIRVWRSAEKQLKSYYGVINKSLNHYSLK